MSYNGWLYGYANPLRYIDPSGNIACELLPPEDQAGCQQGTGGSSGSGTGGTILPPNNNGLPYCIPAVVRMGKPCIPIPCPLPGAGSGGGGGSMGGGLSDDDMVITREDVSTAGSLADYFMSESEVMIMTRVAMGENHVSPKDREYVMWILKLRVELGWSNGRHRHVGDPLIRWGERTDVYRETVGNPGQFEPIGNVLNNYNNHISDYDPLWYCLNSAPNLCAMMYPYTQDQKAAFRATYQLAQQIYASDLNSMPAELKGYDIFFATTENKITYALARVPNTNRLVDNGNTYKDAFPGDNIYLGLVKCADVQETSPNYILGKGLVTLYVKDMSCPPGY